MVVHLQRAGLAKKKVRCKECTVPYRCSKSRSSSSCETAELSTCDCLSLLDTSANGSSMDEPSPGVPRSERRVESSEALFSESDLYRVQLSEARSSILHRYLFRDIAV